MGLSRGGVTLAADRIQALWTEDQGWKQCVCVCVRERERERERNIRREVSGFSELPPGEDAICFMGSLSGSSRIIST